jgi:hypothetical protein
LELVMVARWRLRCSWATQESLARPAAKKQALATVGEAVGLIHDLPKAGELIARISANARWLLNK